MKARARIALCGIILVVVGASPAYAANPFKKYCTSLFFTPREAVSKWGREKIGQAKAWMDKIFLSTEGKIKGATKAAAIDPRGEYDGLWVRDNAINAKEVMDNPEIADAYIDWVRGNLKKHTLGGLGEPKFNSDGSPFNKPWGRPQNDGPGYVILRWTEYAEKKAKEGVSLAAHYDSNLDNASLKWYLEYVSHHWNDASFDLWEEEMGQHLHTMIVMQDGLEKGAALAAKVEPGGANSPAVLWYRQQAAEIRRTILENAWDPDRGYLRSTWRHDGGFVHKQEPLDIGAILGLLHTTTNPPVYRFGDEKVMATMAALEAKFSEIYRLNEQWSDLRYRGIAALGRYPEDVFHGGNPWVIATQGAAEYYFKLGEELLGTGKIEITEVNEKFFKRLMNGNPDFRAGRSFDKDSKAFKDVISAIEEKGDGFLSIVRTSTKADGFHAEQIARGYRPGDQGPWVENYVKEALGGDANRSDAGGQWLGAQLLVWNEASFRSTWRARTEFLAKRRRLGR
ncbi:MAG: hypothetical protein JST04_03340 [Bdellovibrionales bacterium]|nr:hypothetical protein [Bdellovibrionales bacterium]